LLAQLFIFKDQLNWILFCYAEETRCHCKG